MSYITELQRVYDVIRARHDKLTAQIFGDDVAAVPVEEQCMIRQEIDASRELLFVLSLRIELAGGEPAANIERSGVFKSQFVV